VLLRVRRALIEKVRLRNQEHLLNSFWQVLETWIVQYARIHWPLRLGVCSFTPLLINSAQPDLFQEISGDFCGFIVEAGQSAV
jgi:hypothetical protein